MEGNEKADDCAVIDSSLVETMACNDVLVPSVVLAQTKIDDKESKKDGLKNINDALRQELRS